MQSPLQIAVVGMAGIFPGAADLKSFWQNILAGADQCRTIPEHRLGVRPADVYRTDPTPDKTYSQRACLIDHFTFDSAATGLDPELMKALDPLYHLVLKAGRTATLECGLTDEQRRRAGVILAAIALPSEGSSKLTRNIFGWLLKERIESTLSPDAAGSSAPPITSSQTLSACVTGLPAALLARSLDFGGGAYTLDAACASSIYAVKLACDELNAGRADVMLAGGVSRPALLYTQIGFSQLRALSPSGCCRPFDANADGLVVGEGTGLLVLKRLEDAIRDTDSIYGVIQGIGLSNDISGNLLAPDSEGQLRAMQAAYEAAGWVPTDVDLIECHGAGTPRGDQTELESLRQLWGRKGWKAGQCPIGSIKSMIGHLLTAAGAAGMIKTLLALKHRQLPPSIHFERPSRQSPLVDGPFRVQNRPWEWSQRDPLTSRKAAVSAFGFGGINGHVLIEEWLPHQTSSPSFRSRPTSRRSDRVTAASENPSPVAVVGMDAAFGSLRHLGDFQESIFNGRSAITSRPRDRWRGAESALQNDPPGGDWGAYMAELRLDPALVRIPPNELGDILPQHLLMLKTAAAALIDAGLPLRERRPRMGAVIGMEFDYGATDFHLRWHLPRLIADFLSRGLLARTPPPDWIEALQAACARPLTATRTLGALGGIIASRIAREFRLGGPSFTVSCEAASGLKALEIGVRSLQQEETDAVLVGSVDLCGDIRNIVIGHHRRRLSTQASVRPFDRRADGTLPGEGAAAVVLKRLDAAVAAEDRIYAVITGVADRRSRSSGGRAASTDGYRRSFQAACRESRISCHDIDLIMAQACGDPAGDRLETDALHAIFAAPSTPAKCSAAVASVAPVIGHSGASAGLAGFCAACLNLHHRILPPLAHYESPASDLWKRGPFHIPAFSQNWIKNRNRGPRRACVAAQTPDGISQHIILEEAPEADSAALAAKIQHERRRPLGYHPYGLFVVTGNRPEEISDALERLGSFLENYRPDQGPPDLVARHWSHQAIPDPEHALGAALVAEDHQQIKARLEELKNAVAEGLPVGFNGLGGIFYDPEPIISAKRLAFIFPGSGNHYLGMGRETGVRWPDIFRELDRNTEQLQSQMLPDRYIPHRVDWSPGWELSANRRIVSDPLNMLFGQVVHGSLMTTLVGKFGLRPDGVVGYSLGESAGLFALGAWPQRGKMLDRMRRSDLFTRQLAGPCLAARQAFQIPAQDAFEWGVAVVNRPADTVRERLADFEDVRLLIVNTPNESVIGGRKPQVAAMIAALDCEAVYLDGVVTVHCEAVEPVADAYRDLHLFPTTSPPGIRFYSCAEARALELSSRTAADAILKQARYGFDYPATIRQAYADGLNIFIEMGPAGSCTRMIRSILGSQPHVAATACARGENDCLTVLKLLGMLTAARVPVDLAYLYADATFPPRLLSAVRPESGPELRFPVGGRFPDPPPLVRETISAGLSLPAPSGVPETPGGFASRWYRPLIVAATETSEATAKAHRVFLDFSESTGRSYGQAFQLQTRLLQKALDSGTEAAAVSTSESVPPIPIVRTAGDSTAVPESEQVAFDRDLCLEFAVGSLARVLGPEFAVVDSYPARVRLPAEPLMLVDRILSVEGRKGRLGPGRVVTEHDVKTQAWYLDGGRAPVCISVEAGQADLFLCAYLGIDLEVKGLRTYRLLDATVRFHRRLPRPGEIIRYDIRIDRFVRQQQTWLFFFRFEGTIGDEPFISMTNGCAGFFTEQEVRNSGGILDVHDQAEAFEQSERPNWEEICSAAAGSYPESYDETALDALRQGDLAACFGPRFEGRQMADCLRLPGGRMRLIHRILHLDPTGGRYGLGTIRAEADITPDDWFLTCHFVDDRVMPGTLMYECCAHTLKVFLQRMGWIGDRSETGYEPVIGKDARLKCRGPVTPETRRVHYEVEIKAVGFDPEPFVIADAHMYADGRYIVVFHDMSMALRGMDRDALDAYWRDDTEPEAMPADEPSPLFDRDALLSFARGNPSEAFGAPYQPFDSERFIARLPSPPYLLVDRIVRAAPEPWVVKPDGWITAECDISARDWYFRADGSGSMPMAILMEIALQPCGWLAAYMGSALTSEEDLRFRNLGGTGIVHRNVSPAAGCLAVDARMIKSAGAGDMLIETFEFKVRRNDQLIYEGQTYFGFFTARALASQAGIRELPFSGGESKPLASPCLIDDRPPREPEDPIVDAVSGLAMPAKALRMIDRVVIDDPEGGPHRLGLVRGTKTVDPQEWFFKAHFYQDPVWPGSLGIEAFMQLIRLYMIKHRQKYTNTHRLELATGQEHRWTYRGQVTPQNRSVEVTAGISRLENSDAPLVFADGYLSVDGLCIYRMENFGYRLVRN